VYATYKNANTRVVTVLRHVDGDVNLLIGELAKVCGGVQPQQRAGRIEVRGHHTAAIRNWLVGIGF